ncbi:MAG: hypothetical protein HW390_2433 [Candidatus Brocadiaceae bacterium]|nr:hypothetical protein [Candidatus Brocadiaceae bacterium]
MINVALCLRMINRFEQVVENYHLLRRCSFVTSSKSSERYALTGVNRNVPGIQPGERDNSDSLLNTQELRRVGSPQGLQMYYQTHVSHSTSSDNAQRHGDVANKSDVHAILQTSRIMKGLPVWDSWSILLPATFPDVRLSKTLLRHKYSVEEHDFILSANGHEIQSVLIKNLADEAYTSTSSENVVLNGNNLLNTPVAAQRPEISAYTRLNKVVQTQRNFTDRNVLTLLTTTDRRQRVLKTVVTSESHVPQAVPLHGMEYVNPATTAQKTVLSGIGNPANVFAKKTDMTLRKLPSPQTTATVENSETAKRESAVEKYTHKTHPVEHQKELTNHEISKMADSVYKVIEKRIAIEKERRGWR